MTDYKKVYVPRNVQTIAPSKTIEGKYWGKFSEKKVEQHISRISNIAYSQQSPNDMAVCTGTRVEIYDALTMQHKKTAARFKSVVNTAHYRDDGLMLAVGTEDGFVQILDMNSRSILRSFEFHQGSVHVAKFIEDGTKLFTASDDKKVKLIDIPSETTLHTWTAHTDSVRCGLESTVSPNVLITGSYDHTVKLFDSRVSYDKNGTNQSSSCLLSLDHGAPVTDILSLPNNLIATSGDNYIKIWDIVSGGKVVHTIPGHQKTISQMTLGAGKNRLLSVGLDGYLKVYQLQDFSLVHSMKFSGPILSASVAPNSRLLSVGLVDGTLHMRKYVGRLSGAAAVPSTAALAKPKRVRNHSDVVIQSSRPTKTRAFEKYFRSFEYGYALDEALTQSPAEVIAVLEELINRDGLEQAISNRDDVTLQPLLVFLNKHIINPRYTVFLCDIAQFVLEIYAPAVGSSLVVDGILHHLMVTVETEVRHRQSYFSLQGEVDLLLASSSLNYTPSEDMDSEESEEEDDEM